ncbi:MAG TPA: DUF1559 domain-containing protein [Abditibacteriaceae bacterium]|jgi:prepilin-type N-terminal cleavage/methylation domain-containing protein/prepilin-type processing-associated H-X9-DG protein
MIKQKHGFTLIEILITLTIISILAALGFAAFAPVMERGRRVACASNLRQLSLAILQYSQDNNNRLPIGKPSPDSTFTGRGWAGPLYSYVRSAELFRCRSDAGLNRTQGTVSYAYNQALTLNLAATSRPRSTSLLRLRQPSRTVVLFEISTSTIFDLSNPNEDQSPGGNGGNDQLTDGRYATGYLGGQEAGTSFLSSVGRHGGSSNFLMADGSVKSLKAERVSPGMAAVTPISPQIVSGIPYRAAGTSVSTYSATFSPI